MKVENQIGPRARVRSEMPGHLSRGRPPRRSVERTNRHRRDGEVARKTPKTIPKAQDLNSRLLRKPKLCSRSHLARPLQALLVWVLLFSWVSRSAASEQNATRAVESDVAKRFRDKGFSVAGEAVYTNYVLLESRNFIFHFIQVGSKWRLQVGQPDFHEFGYAETGYDGTNLFTLTYNNQKLPTELSRKATNLLYFASGMITNSAFPLTDGANSRIFWEALASHDPVVLNQLGGCGFALDERTPCEKKFKFQLDPETGMLAGAVVLSSSNALQNGTLVPYPAPFSTGIVQTVFTSQAALQSTQSPAARIFSWDYYFPISDMNTIYRQKLGWTVAGRVMQIQPAPEDFDPRPVLTDTVSVRDYRASRVGHIDYLVRTNWLTTDSPEFRMNVEAVERTSRERLLRYLRPLLFIVALTVISVFLIWRTRLASQ